MGVHIPTSHLPAGPRSPAHAWAAARSAPPSPARAPRTAVCSTVASFAAHDALRVALLGAPRERAALGRAVLRLTRAAWGTEADAPSYFWQVGFHVSNAAPKLAAVLLGDAEGEGAPGGVALSPAAVRGVVEGAVRLLASSSGSGTALWCALPRPSPLCGAAPSMWRERGN